MEKLKLFASDENPYEVLNTRSNASSGRIKQRYLEKVKEFPPEQYPEEFKKIRAAYDLLKDPLRKSKYDLENKYGGRIKRLMNKALNCITLRRYDEAVDFAYEALSLAKDNPHLLSFVGSIELFRGNKREFNKYYKMAGARLPAKDKFYLLAHKADLLLDVDEPRSALGVLQEVEESFPKKCYELDPLRVRAYEMLTQHDNAWQVIYSHIGRLIKPDIDDLHSYLMLYSMMRNQERFDQEENVLKSFKNYLSAFKTEEERNILQVALEEEIEGHKDSGRYIEMGHMLELLYHLTGDRKYIKKLESIQEVVALSREIEKIREDLNIFPPVIFKALELFLRQYCYEEDYQDNLFAESKEMLLDMEENDIGYIEGITFLKQHYPLVYKHYQSFWDQEMDRRRKNLNQYERVMTQKLAKMNENFERNPSGTLIKKKKSVGRNDPCPCGSGKKYKKCCGKAT